MNRKQCGALTVEAAIGIPIFLAVVFGWIEICMLTFSMSMTDHALTTSVMHVKKLGSAAGDSPVNYSQMLKEELKQTGGSLWTSSVKGGEVDIKVHYFRNYDSFLQCNENFNSADDCPERRDDAENMAIAVYALQYTYDPLVSIWFPEMQIKREIVTIQEYERCSFKIGEGTDCASS